MNTTGKLLVAGLVAVLAWDGFLYLKESIERHSWWRWSRRYCDQVGKPLLVVGMKQRPWEPPAGDVTLDLDPIVASLPGGVVGNITAMPFQDKEFGVCLVPHVLEHLNSQYDVEQAVREGSRVADIAVFLAPSPYGIVSTLFLPSHKLRLWLSQNTIQVAPNAWRTGIGPHSGVSASGLRPRSVGQHLIVYDDQQVEVVARG